MDKDSENNMLKVLSLLNRALKDKQAEDIVLLNVSHQSTEFSYFVIATGRNEMQLASMTKTTENVFASYKGEYEIVHKEGKYISEDDSTWILLDYGSILVHLFSEKGREYYSLEHIWTDGQITKNQLLNVESTMLK